MSIHTQTSHKRPTSSAGLAGFGSSRIHFHRPHSVCTHPPRFSSSSSRHIRTLNDCGGCVGPARPSCSFRSMPFWEASSCSPGNQVGGWPGGQGLKLMVAGRALCVFVYVCVCVLVDTPPRSSQCCSRSRRDRHGYAHPTHPPVLSLAAARASPCTCACGNEGVSRPRPVVLIYRSAFPEQKKRGSKPPSGGLAKISGGDVVRRAHACLGVCAHTHFAFRARSNRSMDDCWWKWKRKRTPPLSNERALPVWTWIDLYDNSFFLGVVHDTPSSPLGARSWQRARRGGGRRPM